MTTTLTSFAELKSLTARDLMGDAGQMIRTGACVAEVMDRFLTGPSRHLVVIGDDGRCVGVIGPRHLAQARRYDPKLDASRTPIEVLDYAPWISLSPDDDLRTCARMLVEHSLDAVPVLDEDHRVLGVVTAHAIARAAADIADPRPCMWGE